MKPHLLIVAAAAFTLLGFHIAPAGASNFSGATGATGCGGGSPVNMADNAAHYFWYDSLTNGVENAQNNTRSSDYDPTDVNTFDDSSAKPTTDVIVRDQDYSTFCGYSWHPGGGLWGLATCNSVNGADECESHDVRYDISYIEVATQAERRGLACHETGHSLGLMHRDAGNGCMKQYGAYPASLTEHDTAHLNANY